MFRKDPADSRRSLLTDCTSIETLPSAAVLQRRILFSLSKQPTQKCLLCLFRSLSFPMLNMGPPFSDAVQLTSDDYWVAQDLSWLPASRAVIRWDEPVDCGVEGVLRRNSRISLRALASRDMTVPIGID